MCLQVHVDGEAGAALSPFLAGFGGWLSPGLGNGFSMAVPGALAVPRWGFGCCCWQRQQRCRSGSEAAAPAPNWSTRDWKSRQGLCLEL